MQYRAAIFDIDGTLLPHGAMEISPATAQALRMLQMRGMQVIVATGRAPCAARAVLAGVAPDALVSANGALTQDAAGHTQAAVRLSAEAMYALVDFCEDYELPLDFAFEDGYYAYVEYERMRTGMVRNDANLGFLHDGEDQVRHLQSMPLAACVCAPAERVQAFTTQYGHLGLRFVPFAPGKYDVYHESVNKARAVEHVLRKSGISWSGTVAFGDGENDAELLEAAGFAVTPENGAPMLRRSADLIAPPCREDGVVRVIRKYFSE